MFATLLNIQSTSGSNDLIQAIVATPIFALILKILFIAGALLYLAFSFVVVRQITLMRQTVITALSAPLQMIGYIHFVAAACVVLLFFIIL